MTIMSVAKTRIDDHEGPWTVEDVLSLPEHPARARFEVVDGALMMSPAPSLAHQTVAYELHKQLEDSLERSGAPFVAAETVNVRTESRLFIPDIAVMDHSAVEWDTLIVPLEAMVLLVEIVSPCNQSMDRIFKPALYAQAKVPAYWRVELQPDLHVVAHELATDAYREVATITGKQTVEVAGEFTVDLDVPALRGRLARGGRP
ncbi:Uma2 family endonuclease [Streptomyces hygroscopicus subsp. hygroscopicus]|uniref:Uma2 family endonuclease n=2 Tax=Streptomyces TaxID=1883 RepID=A0ABT9L0F9_9ACTN|nr:Uma2 family endonuclease [Streptomyces hygroscopicus subsp. hygroscopicus]MDP9614168.1 Uma2 family endonuclease [Streptomyces demainii]